MKAIALIASLLLLAGCADTMQIIQTADYGCLEGNLDGPATDSSASGRGIWLPEGQTLTAETIEMLCR